MSRRHRALGPPGPFLGSWLRPFWDHFGIFWDNFGTILGPFLGPSWEHFGTILGLKILYSKVGSTPSVGESRVRVSE